MPIYEFYCADCHTIFNFFARSSATDKQPDCPRCGRPKLERQISRFAISKGRSESEDEPDPLAGMDEAKLEQALAELSREAENASEDDPRQMAQVMRKLYESTGMQLGEGMQEAMRRLEAGEDPDKIEEEMGDLLESEDPMFGANERSLRKISQKIKPPNVDETLYDL